MTSEANDNDPRVSRAYREIANEETPAELDRAVLAMAAAEARPAKGVSRNLFRPLAWAATIALSFAFVLEMSEVGEEPMIQTDADLAEVLQEGPATPETTSEGTRDERKDEGRLKQQLNKRSSDVPVSGKAALAPASAPPPEMSSVAAEAESDSSGLLREAEERARVQSEAAGAVSAYAVQEALVDGCDEAARESAKTWYECVENLRAAGQDELARRELEHLRAEFPDFREPAEQAPPDR